MDKTYESEKQLEENLIIHLVNNGWERVSLASDKEIILNFRKQIEKHNSINLSDKEFERLLNCVKGKGIFSSAKNIRQKQVIKSDKDINIYIQLFDARDWCKNEFQVSNQITQVAKYETRYDVTLLINGLPVVQIELKKRGIDFKEAFNQIQRYRRHAFTGLFHYVQFFVVSNGVDTKYFANSDKEINFENTFFWSDNENNRISNLFDFTMYFLAKCHVAKMIARYMVIDETSNSLMIMKPYQVYAVEALIDRATETNNNAYVWHTTGSGKTLTSFKLCKLLKDEPNIIKVFFLVDRRDLDHQTIEQFNRFEPNSVDLTDSTKQLVKYIKDSSIGLIITTIQKMSNACNDSKYADIISKFQDKKVIFVIDECHRTQFGEMHKAIQKKFPKAQYFGFTGTPRFQENPSADGRTTADIFKKLLHTYLIKDAIRDGNVLGFNVDYVKTIKDKIDTLDNTKVEAIDTDEAIMAPKRIEMIAEDVLKRWNYKTRNGNYNAIMTVKNIPMLIQYYKTFKKINKNLKIGAIYTFTPNGEDGGGNREELEDIINDYNIIFKTNFSTNTFANYAQDVSKKIKTNQLNLLIVVNMFLTGFDACCLNTLFVDKKIQFHDLVQAFSRTNRIEKATKPFGNIVCYQTTNKTVDDAITLFSQTNSTDNVLMKSLDFYIKEFKKSSTLLLKAFPNVDSIILGQEPDNYRFIILFRELIKLLVKLNIFLEFDDYDWEKTFGFSKNDYQEYLSKYLAISRKDKKEKTSILNEVDFCIDLLRTDKITVTYILKLLSEYVKDNDHEKIKKRTLKEIIKLLDQGVDEKFRLKTQLIINFINNIVPTINQNQSIDEEFEIFQIKERNNELDKFAHNYHLSKEILEQIISDYQYSGLLPTALIRETIHNSGIAKMFKETRKLPTIFKTRGIIIAEISNFVKYISDKYE